MHDIHWTEPAADDLERIIDYLAQFNPIAAAATGEHLVNAIQGMIAHMPLMFRAWEVNPTWRCCAVVHPYLIFYTLDGNTVIIRRILHGKRQFP